MSWPIVLPSAIQLLTLSNKEGYKIYSTALSRPSHPVNRTPKFLHSTLYAALPPSLFGSHQCAKQAPPFTIKSTGGFPRLSRHHPAYYLWNQKNTFFFLVSIRIRILYTTTYYSLFALFPRLNAKAFRCPSKKKLG